MTPRQSNANENQFIPVTSKKPKSKQDNKDLPMLGMLLTHTLATAQTLNASQST